MAIIQCDSSYIHKYNNMYVDNYCTFHSKYIFGGSIILDESCVGVRVALDREALS